MTFDDGILTICKRVNIAENGKMPKYEETEASRHYYKMDTLGFNRYYTALQANQQISAVVNIPEWEDIDVRDICVLDDGTRYIIQTVQRMYDENNLKITKLSLEKDVRA